MTVTQRVSVVLEDVRPMAMGGEKPLTTGEVAKLCGVNFRTVIRWIERGHLKAFKLPGRGDNRILVPDFVQFLQDHHMPIPKELSTDAPTILVVDDDPSVARSIQRALVRAGYETDIAESGFVAGSMLAAHTPTLMTLDLTMPGMDGFEVLRFVRSQEAFAALKILVISGLDRTTLELAKEAGADDVLEKPFNRQQLIDKIQILLST